MIGMNPAEFANIANCERDFWWYRGVRAILFHVLAPFLNGRTIKQALEAGCGTGYFSHLLENERGWPVVALDFSADGLRYAQEMGVKRPVQGDTCKLPFTASTFDMVLSMDVLPHLLKGLERQAMTEMAHVLAPGGLLAVRAAALDILHSRHSAFAFERQRFTRRQLHGLAEEAGLRVLRCTYTNALLLPVAPASSVCGSRCYAGRPPAASSRFRRGWTRRCTLRWRWKPRFWEPAEGFRSGNRGS